MKKIIITILSVVLYLVFTSCEYDRISMPNSNDSSQLFNSGEIKYIQMNPVWNDFVKPIDIFISQDDYIFLADSGNQQVVVLDKTGDIITSDESGNDFEALSNLDFSPVGLCVDSKLNVFMTDKSNKIYVWNQFVNNASNSSEGNDSIATSIVYRNLDNGETVTITEFAYSYLLEGNGYIIDKVNYEFNKFKTDSLLGVHLFYESENDVQSEFVSVAAAPSKVNAIYVTDQANQEIQKVFLARSAYVKLADGTTVWQHKGFDFGTIATAGTGAGTINDPTGIFVDPSGSVFYTQTGINFGFHKISELSVEEQIWGSMFTLSQNEILELNRFENPQDVAVDDDGNIFVLNSAANEVQVFDNGGSFIRKAGLRSVQIDITIQDTIDNQIVERDTIITKYYNDILNNPRGIFVDNGVIYIVNSGDNNIIRFILSSDIDVVLEE